jgi:hypothetical protein
VIVGMISYSATLLLLWKFAKCPEGAESYLLKKIFPKLQNKF